MPTPYQGYYERLSSKNRAVARALNRQFGEQVAFYFSAGVVLESGNLAQPDVRMSTTPISKSQSRKKKIKKCACGKSLSRETGEHRGPCRQAAQAKPRKKKSRRKWIDYEEYISSEVWAEIRRRYWASVGIKVCQFPGCERTTPLHVHHLTYDRFGGDELLSDLLGLCKPHHDAVHEHHQMERGRLEREAEHLGLPGAHLMLATEEVTGLRLLGATSRAS